MDRAITRTKRRPLLHADPTIDIDGNPFLGVITPRKARERSWGHDGGTDVGATLTVSTGREHRPVVGGDSTVFEMHSEFYVDVGQGRRSLAVTPFRHFLQELAEVQAANLGEELHHADFVITIDPTVVRELGLMHDCADCQDSMSQTMAFMASNPDQEMVVGQMFWAGA